MSCELPMSTDLKFKPLRAFVLSRLNSGSSTCWRATSSQSMDMSPTAAMTQLRSAMEASFLAADAARFATLGSIGFGSLGREDSTWEPSAEFGTARTDGSVAIGDDVDELVGRPSVAAGKLVVGVADRVGRIEEGLGPRDVVVSNRSEMGWFGCWACPKIASFWSLEAETELTLEMTSEASSFGRERESATKLALPCTYLMSVVYSLIHDNWYV